MAEIPGASGNLRQHSLARLLVLTHRKALTGRLEIASEDGPVRVYFRQGLVCQVETPRVEDTLGQILMENGSLSLETFQELLARMSRDQKSEAQVLGEMGVLDERGLLRILAQQLRRRMLRIFSLEDAPFRLFTGEHAHGVEGEESEIRVDTLWAVLHGVRSGYTESRLTRDLEKLGGLELRLVATFSELAPRFGLSSQDQTAADALSARFLAIDQFVQASRLGSVSARMLLYAFWVTDLLESRPASQQGRPSKTVPAVKAPAREAPKPAVRDSVSIKEADALVKRIADKLRACEGADYFHVLEVSRDASRDEVRQAYLGLARAFHPDRLSAFGLDEMRPSVEKVFLLVGDAYRMLYDDVARQQYVQTLAAAAASKESRAPAAQDARRLVEAELAFQRGLIALNRNDFDAAETQFQAALQLNPAEGEVMALLGWAMHSNPQRNSDEVHGEAMELVSKGVALSPRCARAFYYLGQMHADSGAIEDALLAYERAIRLKPGYLEAEREIRLIHKRQEQRENPKPKGLLDRFRKR